MDRRDRSFPKPVINSKTNRLVVTVTDDEGEELEQELPFKFEVCSTCQGKGSHVNPSIDSEGISAEDFSEDPDFEESYFGGDYDQTCVECDGLRVTPVVDLETCSAEEKKIAQGVERSAQADYDYQTERDSERRHGY